MGRPIHAFLALLIGVGGSLTPTPARAQTDVSAPGRTQEIEKVERGVSMAVEVGPAFLVAPDDDTGYDLGLAAGLWLGFDLGPIFRLSIGTELLGVGGSTMLADSTGSSLVLRDRFYVSPGVRVALALLTTERDFLWLRAQGGLGIFLGSEDLAAEGDLGVAFGASVAYEHFATLRHFSFGVQAGLTGYLSPDLALGISVMPSLRYSF